MCSTSFVLLASCSGEIESCGSAWHPSRDAPPIELRTLKRLDFTVVETRLIAEVDRCYRPQYPNSHLRFSQEWRDKAGNRYLVFDIYGVSDIEFVAVVDRSGRIVRTGNSTLNF